MMKLVDREMTHWTENYDHFYTNKKWVIYFYVRIQIEYKILHTHSLVFKQDIIFIILSQLDKERKTKKVVQLLKDYKKVILWLRIVATESNKKDIVNQEIT